nr:hypothetical protein [Sphingomonas sp. 66-10]
MFGDLFALLPQRLDDQPQSARTFILHDRLRDAQSPGDILLREPLDLAQLEDEATAFGQVRNRLAHAMIFATPVGDPLGCWGLIHARDHADLGYRFDIHDPVVTKLTDQQIAHNAEEKSRGALDMIEAGQLGDMTISLLDQIIAIIGCNHRPRQPRAYRRLVRRDFSGDPLDQPLSVVRSHARRFTLYDRPS